MPLNPKFFEMGAKTWRDPVTHKKFIEEEKARRAAEKDKKEQEAFKKEVEVEKSKLIREKVAETGRLVAEEKQNEYLAKLKADVARLESKKTGQTPDKAIAAFDKDRVKDEAKEREEAVGKEVKLTAAEMVKAQERELAEKKKKQEKEIADLADRRRRELLEYKHALGLSSDSRSPPHRPLRFPNRPRSLYDDPEFWKLPVEDQRLLETMSPDARAQYGFGPFEEDEVEYDGELRARFAELGIGKEKMKEVGLGGGAVEEKRLKEKMRNFVCTDRPELPGLIRRFEPLALNLPLEVADIASYEPHDRPAVQQILHEQSKALRDELVRLAIEQCGANALLEFRCEGPIPLEEEALQQEGWLSEIVAQGIPARLDPRAAARLKQGKNVRFRSNQHGFGQQQQHGGWNDNMWGTESAGGGGGWNNGGAGWNDPPAFGGGGGDGRGDCWGGGGGDGGRGKDDGWGGGGGIRRMGGWGGEDLWGGGKRKEKMPGGWGANDGWGATGHGGGGGGGWDSWDNQGGNGWGQTGGGGWGGWRGDGGGGWNAGGGVGWNGNNGGWGQGGAVWGGGRGAGWGAKPSLRQAGGHPEPPADVRNLPFGAQMYIKRMRDQQEREMREAAAAAATGVHGPPQPAQHQPHATPAAPQPHPSPAGEDPALFGNAFSRQAFPFSPHPAAAVGLSPRRPDAAAPSLFQSAAPPQAGPVGTIPGPAHVAGSTHDRLRAQMQTQKPTSDPDNGNAAGGWVERGGSGGTGWGYTAAPAEGGSAGGGGVVPSVENGWKGAQPW
ncbi:hypothetical protein JCM8547_004822 [Rhodosporidiobolus lusitaniae]